MLRFVSHVETATRTSIPIDVGTYKKKTVITTQRYFARGKKLKSQSVRDRVMTRSQPNVESDAEIEKPRK